MREVDFTFVDMPGYFYREDIAFLGNVTVGGGSLGVRMVTDTGTFELQPFLRYDKGHKQGLKTEHFNPHLRVINDRGKEIILPEKSKYKIFGKEMPEVLKISTTCLWRAYYLDNPQKELHGKIAKKFKKKPPTTKKILKE